MTWTYNVTQLAVSPLYQVRLSIGDTLAADPQMQDEEIVQFIAGRTTLAGAAADCCRALSSKFSRSVTLKGGGTTANYSDLSKAYMRMAINFDQMAAKTGGALPYAGGISVTDKQAVENDADRVEPQFNIGLDDNLVAPIGSSANQTLDNPGMAGSTE
jgi:hypothetical protein